MADATGPISSLPGATHAAPAGSVCDDHPDRVVYRRVQGETDSFGCEMHDLCKECYDEHVKACAEADTAGRCDWCGNHAPKLRKRRDFEEGSCGPVYDVCDDCVKAENERCAAERKELEDSYLDYDDYDED